MKDSLISRRTSLTSSVRLNPTPGHPKGVKTMLEISIIKIRDAGCFWGRVLKGTGLHIESPKEYEDLQVRMNLFYHQVSLDVQKITPPSLAEQQVCVVYSSVLRSWCRAVVETVFEGTEACQLKCFLVDHAEHLLVSSDSVRAPLERFLQLPFWVKKFQLAGVCPVRLQVPVYKDQARLVLSTHWDSSATRYLHNLVQASSLMEAVLCGVQEDSTIIELYLTIRNVKICVNDDLVTKKFACFWRGDSGSSSHSCLDDPAPAMLASDIFSSAYLARNGCVSRALWSTVSPRKDLQNIRSVSGAGPTAGFGSGTDSKLSREDPEVEAGPAAECVGQGLSTLVLEGRRVCGGVASGGGVASRGGVDSEEGVVSEEGVAEGTSDSSKASEAGASLLDSSQGVESHCEVKTGPDSSLADELRQKLTLFRFMKFLNPVSKSEEPFPKTDVEEDEEAEMVKSVAEDATEARTAPHPDEISAAPPPGHESASAALAGEEEEGAMAFTEQRNLGEELACARLLQLLNPDPLNVDAEFSADTVGEGSPCQNVRSGILVHSAIAIDPCTSLAKSPIAENIRKDLVRKGYSGPDVAECYCWPAVARGCDTVLISSRGTDPLTYIPPLLSHLHLSSGCSAPRSHTGPRAVVLCRGWEKAQRVFDLLEELTAAACLHPMILLVGREKDEARNVKIQRNCQLLVTTPSSLNRLLMFHCFLFLRLAHMVLDEVDVLFSHAPEEMASALQHFHKAAPEERGSSTKQIIAVGRGWRRGLEGLVREHMTDPCIIVTSMEEAALYGGVHQMILLCLDCTKVSVLLGALDFIPHVAQRTLIITNSVEEVEHVFKAVNNTAAFCLKVHEHLTHQFDSIVEQWRKDIGQGTHVILVMTNECVKALQIRDATCVVHFGFPSSPRLFGRRLGCMSENFQNLSDKDCEKPSRMAKSVLLLSERDARHVIGVQRYLERAGATLPPELLLFSQGVLRAKEDQKTDRPLCSYLKSFGFCRDQRVCPDRHHVNPQLDAPQHPASGSVVVLPLYIKDASCYCGRVVSGKDDPYETFAAEMAEYFASEKFNAKEVVEGEMYGIEEEGIFRRIQALVVPEKGERLFCSLKVRFLDEGREQEVKAHQLLMLPRRFQSLPPQALELIVCRARPIDGEDDWNPKVNRYISQKIKGVEHRAQIVLSLGNTVWLDPMVRVTRLPGLNTSINEYDLRAVILATGMGVANPEHLEALRALCREAPDPADPPESAEMAPVESLLSGGEGSGVLASPQGPAGVPWSRAWLGLEHGPPPGLDHPAGTQTGQLQNGPLTLEDGLSAGSCDGFGPPLSASPAGVPTQVTWQSPLKGSVPEDRTPASCLENGVEPIKDLTSNIAPKRFHPQIKWFEREDFVVLNVKLLSPTEQTCEFFSDRVVYSACSNDRRYHADLELRGQVVPDKCTWDVKCNEPVMRLVKEERGAWNMLLKQKSTFVTFDFDHLEEDEPAMWSVQSQSPLPINEKGRWFTEHTGEEGCYVRSDTETESD